MVRIVTFVLAVALASLPALAGDIYSRGSTKDAPVAVDIASYSWTGFYIGAQGGYGFVNRELSFDVDHEGGTDELFGLDGLGGEGFIVGPRVGVDFQLDRVVARVRVDYSFSDIETAARLFGAGEATFEKKDEWMAWAGAGVTLNERTLLYVLAGYGETTYELNCAFCGDANGFKQDYEGFGLAAGLEHAIARDVTVSLEGQYIMWDETTLAKDDGFKINDETREFRVLLGGNWKIRLGDMSPLN